MRGENGYVESMLDRTYRALPREAVDRVRSTTVAVAGLGGVGAVTAELLARWGVKRFRLMDMDRYEPSNLNRQLFATSKTLGRWKVDVAAERILEINPYAHIELKIAERVNNENVEPFVKGAGIVIQNADYPSAKLFYLAASRHRVPLVNGYATVTGGRVQGFDYRVSPCRTWVDDWWQRIKLGGAKPLTALTAEELGAFDHENVHPTAASINFVTNTVGCLIVGEAIKLLTGKGRPVLYPYYLEFDIFKLRWRRRHVHSLMNPGSWQAVLAAVKRRLSSFGTVKCRAGAEVKTQKKSL